MADLPEQPSSDRPRPGEELFAKPARVGYILGKLVQPHDCG